MNQNLLFQFNVDKTAKSVFITREFNAPLRFVWDAFTQQELLDQWWAPAPYRAKTKYMDFVVGGKRFYAMISPDGQEHWAIQEYRSISPQTNFNFFNAFADPDERPQLPGSDWNLHFSEKNGITSVRIIIYNESFERMEQLLEGFRLGFTASLENLANLLATQAHI
ncbi:MAG: SRPBCC domain-containing protein [Bacteroidetes bacterium]|nr:SRPBCC domain-containing protein [Bacteroidota bacterium]MBS1629314.1 SRPBCC domain-containing protein [Bacteroidota bacterium]